MGLFDTYRSLGEVYEGSTWDTSMFKGVKKTQNWLRLVVSNIFPNYEVFTDYHHPDLEAYSGRRMELDIYLPELKLALEYHGEQHYHPVRFFSEDSQVRHRNTPNQYISHRKLLFLTPDLPPT